METTPERSQDPAQDERTGVQTLTYQRYGPGGWSESAGPVVVESLVTVYINGREFVTMMASPANPEHLAVGYLYTEGIIRERSEIADVRPGPRQTCVDIWLEHSDIELPKQRVLTTGCGKGVTFADGKTNDEAPLLPIGPPVSHETLARLMHALQSEAGLYRAARGVHAAGLAKDSALVMMTEDVGRHNTLDRLAGRCLLEGYDPAGHILLTSGRVSSEMMKKARQMRIPLVASRTSPTNLSIQRANDWGITLVGYLRPQSMIVYTHPQRIVTTLENETHTRSNP